MILKLTHITTWVKYQDEALRSYMDKLGFRLHTDDSTTIPAYRFLTVAPAQQSEVEIVLGLAAQPEEIASIGKQGTRVLASDDVHEDYERLRTAGVKVHSQPNVAPYGTDFVFEDLYGNTSDLVQAPGGQRAVERQTQQISGWPGDGQRCTQKIESLWR